LFLADLREDATRKGPALPCHLALGLSTKHRFITFRFSATLPAQLTFHQWT
jgi:hypothetical protein